MAEPTAGTPDANPLGTAAQSQNLTGGTVPQTDPPPLPENATPEQKDEHWYRHVYQGDRMPQLTIRAVLMGGVLGMLMAAANLYTTLSIGWAFGIAITSVVMSYVVFTLLRAVSGGRIGQMSILENACMASTASAAGYSTGSTIATMFGALVLLEEIPAGKTAADIKTWDVTAPWIVVLFTLLTGLMGVLLAIPMKRQQINHEQLPFPTGTAAAETLRSLYGGTKEAVRKAWVLVAALVFGLILAVVRAGDALVDKIWWLKQFHEWCVSNIKFALRIPEEFELHMLDGLYPSLTAGKPLYPGGFSFETSGLLVAAGMMVGLRISLSLLIASLVLYVGVGPWLAAKDLANTQTEGWVNSFRYFPDETGPFDVVNMARWALWGGTAVMVFASLTSVALQWRTLVRAFRGGGGGKASGGGRADIEVPASWMIIGMVPVGLAMVWLQIQAFSVVWWAGVIAVAMSFVLSLVASRATGETDTTPIGAMGKVMQLLFAVLQPNNTTINLAAAGIAANSASSSADLLTDLKTGYLLGANPRKQFIAQFIGVFFGTLAIVPIWYLMVPTRAELETYDMPGTLSWAAVATLLKEGVKNLPDSAIWAIFIGSGIGVMLPVIERLLPAKARKFMPSATGIGLAWVMTFSNAFAFAIGAVIAYVWFKIHRRSNEAYNVPLASGLIAGEALMSAILAIIATVIGLWNAAAAPAAGASP